MTLSVKLDFLGKGNYILRTFSDMPESNEDPTVIAESTRTVPANDVLEIKMETAGGFAATLAPENKP